MAFPPTEVIRLALFRQPDLGRRRLLTLFLKGVCQHDELASLQKSKQAERVTTHVNTDFPDVVGVDQFLKIVGRHKIQVAHHTQHPDNLLNGLVRQVIQMLLHGTTSGCGGVEPDLFHADTITYM